MIRLALLDMAKHTRVNRWYKFFRSSLDWDRDTIIRYQNKRLNELIEYAYAKVPYYKDLFNELKIAPQKIRTQKDLFSIPILDREIIRTRQNDLISSENRVSDLKKGSSSGTTGIPIDYYFSNEGMSAGIAAGYILWGLSGWFPGQRSVHIWGNESSIKRWRTWSSKAKNICMKQLNIPSVLLNDPGNIPAITDQLRNFHPESIDGYSSSIFTLSKYLKGQNLKIHGLKQVLTTAENLESYQKEVIEEILAPAGDLYGCGEILGIASRPVNENRYYVFEPHVIVETVDSGIKGMKDILVTDLDNYAMPMIRYKVGDMMDELNPPGADSKYPFSWFTRIIGRSSDIITLSNGMLFHPVNIFGGTTFRKFPEITKHKVIWDGYMVKFLFETDNPLDKAGLELKLNDLLKPYEVPFRIEYTQKILPSPGGKFKYVEIIEKVTEGQ